MKTPNRTLDSHPVTVKLRIAAMNWAEQVKAPAQDADRLTRKADVALRRAALAYAQLEAAEQQPLSPEEAALFEVVKPTLPEPPAPTPEQLKRADAIVREHLSRFGIHVMDRACHELSASIAHALAAEQAAGAATPCAACAEKDRIVREVVASSGHLTNTPRVNRTTDFIIRTFCAEQANAADERDGLRDALEQAEAEQARLRALLERWAGCDPDCLSWNGDNCACSCGFEDVTLEAPVGPLVP